MDHEGPGWRDSELPTEHVIKALTFEIYAATDRAADILGGATLRDTGAILRSSIRKTVMDDLEEIRNRGQFDETTSHIQLDVRTFEGMSVRTNETIEFPVQPWGADAAAHISRHGCGDAGVRQRNIARQILGELIARDTEEQLRALTANDQFTFRVSERVEALGRLHETLHSPVRCAQ